MQHARRAAAALALSACAKLGLAPHRVDVAWDLDGTLITHQRGVHADAQHVYSSPRSSYSLYLRPGAGRVLWLLSLFGNRQVLFTAATQGYADSIVNALLPGHLPQRLYRDALTVQSSHGKDLNRVTALLGGALDSTLLIDDQPRNRCGGQHLCWVRRWDYGQPGGADLYRAAAVVLLSNLIGPKPAFALLQGVMAPPPPPQTAQPPQPPQAQAQPV